MAQVKLRNRFLRIQRIRKRSDFEKFRSDCAVVLFGSFFIIKILERSVGEGEDVFLPRIGIITPKKIGKAVERNRVRRIVREFFRTNRCLFSGSSDYLFIALPGIADIKNCELTSNMAKILTKRSYNLPGRKNVSFLQKSIR